MNSNANSSSNASSTAVGNGAKAASSISPLADMNGQTVSASSSDGRQSPCSSAAATAGSSPASSQAPGANALSSAPLTSIDASGRRADGTSLPGYATVLLNLEVKVLTQALGAENQWVEQGDGRVAFCDFTIRVIAPRPGKDDTVKSKKSVSRSGSNTGGDGDAGLGGLSNTISEFDEEDAEGENEVVILEDTISNDTPFVGENCCIVWNSFEKQLSLCLMYASEEGYSASWSALVALQDKSYPPFRFDLLERCRPHSPRAVVPGNDSTSSGTELAPTGGAGEAVLPYSYFIHAKYDPPLGFIEQHAVSLSIIEHRHATNPALYASKETVLIMLNLANGDLLDFLVGEDTFPLLLSGLGFSTLPVTWTVPEPLRQLHVPDEVVTSIRKDRLIGFLQESVLPACGTTEAMAELTAKYTTMSRRLRNDIVCALLTCDSIFSEACEALRVVPPAITSGAGISASPRNRVPSLEISSSTTSVTSDPRSSPVFNASVSVNGGAASPKSPPPASEAVPLAQKVEQQVLAHLRFFRELVMLSIGELNRDMVGPIIGKVLQCGLMEPLSLVAERYAMPSGTALPFAKHVMDGPGGGLGGVRRGNNNGAGAPSSSATTTSSANCYSPAVEAELAALLDATLVRLNERQEEHLMNEHVRIPILADPLKYNGIVTFMLRQLVVGGVVLHSGSGGGGGVGGSNVGGAAAMLSASGTQRSSFSYLPQPKRILRDSMSSSNPYALFHVLGLHDDEGSSSSERVLDAESTDVRNRFHNFIVTKYIAHATRGLMTPVPLPPSLGGLGAAPRNMPIVQFSNANAGRPALHDVNESSAFLGVPNTGVGTGAGHTSGSGAGDASGGGGSAVGVSSGGGCASGGGGTASPVLPLPQGITPPLIRVLEYMITLTNNANRELVLKTVFHHKSRILHFIEGVCDTLCGANGWSGRCQVGLDVLCGCVRFLKVVITQMALAQTEMDDNPLPSYITSREPLPPQLVTAICRQLTVERDTFGYLLKAYNRLGGLRRNSVFHSSLLAVLDLIGRCPNRDTDELSGNQNNLHDVRDYLFFRHVTRLPEVFARRYREALLGEVRLRLGHEAPHSANDSVSVLSSTAGSELVRSSSRLRFVDEVEAVSGGVDGTVVAGSVVSPAIVASMASLDEKQRKRSGRFSMEQWSTAANHMMNSPSQVRSVAPLSLTDDHGGRRSPSSPAPTAVSPPMTISITRPGSSNARAPTNDVLKPGSNNPTNGSAQEGDLVVGASSPLSPGLGAQKTEPPVLRPTAPKEEKPPGRPRNFASVLESPARATTSPPIGTTASAAVAGGDNSAKGRVLPQVGNGISTPPSSPEEVQLARAGANHTAPQSLERAMGPHSPTSENVLLPKIKKRLSTNGRR